MRFSTSSIASLLLVAGTVAFIATAVGEHLSLGELVARSTARRNALQAQLLIRRTGTLLLDLETGQRGFIITGEAVFLEPYERAMLELGAADQALKNHLGRDGQPLPLALHRLEALIVERVAQVRRNVDQRWALGDVVLKDLPAYLAGKALMDEIRGELGQLEAEQALLAKQAERDIDEVRQRTTVLALVLPTIGCLLIVGAFLALRREQGRRDQAEQALLSANANLESEVAKRTHALSSALTRIQSFASELDDSVETERRRLAREVHDQVGQLGTAAKMQVLALRRRLGPEHQETMSELLGLADDAIDVARQISASLRPPLLDDFGLAAAAKHYGKSLERQGGMTVQVDVRDDELLSPSQANQLFRILQEAATNVLRHANAQLLRIVGLPVAESYVLEIIDDGRGPGAVRVDASGLRNMRERAALAGGHFEFGPGPEGGTRVHVLLPLEVSDLEEA